MPSKPNHSARTPVGAINFTTIDFETANRHRSSPISVGVAKVRAGRIVDSAARFITPPPGFRNFEQRCVAVHGIRPSHIAGAPDFAATLEWLVNFAAGDLMVAHNVGFDRSVINKTCETIGVSNPGWDWACTLQMSRKMLDLPGNGLSSISEHFGLPDFDHHDAGADAIQCAGVMIGFAERFEIPQLTRQPAPAHGSGHQVYADLSPDECERLLLEHAAAA